MQSSEYWCNVRRNDGAQGNGVQNELMLCGVATSAQGACRMLIATHLIDYCEIFTTFQLQQYNKILVFISTVSSTFLWYLFDYQKNLWTKILNMRLCDSDCVWKRKLRLIISRNYDFFFTCVMRHIHGIVAVLSKTVALSMMWHFLFRLVSTDWGSSDDQSTGVQAAGSGQQ